MDIIYQKIIAGITTVALSITALFGAGGGIATKQDVQNIKTQVDQYIEQSLEDNAIFGSVLPIAGTTYNLSGAGISNSATTIVLQSLTLTQIGYPIQDSELSDTFYITLEPGSRSKQEIVSCTTVTQNANGTASLTGCTRGLSPITPYTASSSLRFSHAGGSQVIFSDPPQLFNLYAAKENNETITGSWLFPSPVSGSNPATKTYVDSLAFGGSVTTDRVTIAGTAGETLAAGNLIYLRTSDARWYKVSTAFPGTVLDSITGIAQGVGTAGVSITGGVLIHGEDSNQSGLTVGANYFASSTSGGIGTATTTKGVGKAKSTTVLHFDPYFLLPQLGTNNTFTGTTTVASTTIIGSTHAFSIGKNVFVASTTGTWNVPSGIKKIEIEVIGAGGGGGDSGSGTGGGGGGGAYCKGIVDVSATTTVFMSFGTAGAGGTGNGSGGTGGNTTFSTFVTAGGGTGGTNSSPGLKGVGGDCSGSSVVLGTFVEIEDFDGDDGLQITGGSTDYWVNGRGGDNIYGQGGEAFSVIEFGGDASGKAGRGYGAGGSGGIGGDDGGAGSGGMIIIRY